MVDNGLSIFADQKLDIPNQREFDDMPNWYADYSQFFRYLLTRTTETRRNTRMARSLLPGFLLFVQ